MYHNLKEKAIFIADAHYPNHKKKDFLTLLNGIKNKTIECSQLILMGDIFDLLVGNSSYLKNRFKTEIKLLEDIAKNKEVIYLEGNHDFNLSVIFKKVKIIKINQQPLIATYDNKKYALSHGDKYNMSLSYQLYTKIVRNPFILQILPDYIAIKKLQQMSSKDICKDIKNFNKVAQRIAKNYHVDYIVEGHYHQGKIINNYISLPSFACNGEVGILNNKKLIFKKLIF